MKTIVNAVVVESNDLDFAVEVKFDIVETNITAVATVVNTTMHGENAGFVVGTVMAKPHNVEDVRVHPVARESNGRFASLKGLSESVLNTAKAVGGQYLGLEQVDVSVSNLPIMDKELVVVNNIVEMDFGKNTKPKPITRVQGGIHLEAPKPMVEVVNYIDHESRPEDFDPLYNIDVNDIDNNVVVMDVNHNRYEDYSANTQTNEVCNSIQQIVKQACRIVYDYFNTEMYSRTVNREQLIKQFSIVWNKNPQLHVYKEEMRFYVFDCIKYYFNEALGNRVFMNRQELVNVVKKALTHSVQLSLAA